MRLKVLRIDLAIIILYMLANMFIRNLTKIVLLSSTIIFEFLLGRILQDFPECLRRMILFALLSYGKFYCKKFRIALWAHIKYKYNFVPTQWNGGQESYASNTFSVEPILANRYISSRDVKEIIAFLLNNWINCCNYFFEYFHYREKLSLKFSIFFTFHAISSPRSLVSCTFSSTLY